MTWKKRIAGVVSMILVLSILMVPMASIAGNDRITISQNGYYMQPYRGGRRGGRPCNAGRSLQQLCMGDRRAGGLYLCWLQPKFGGQYDRIIHSCVW